MALLAASSFEIKAQTCKPSGGIRGKKPPAGQCNRENDSDCCVQVSKREVMVVVHQRVTNTTTRMTHQLSHYQLDGTREGILPQMYITKLEMEERECAKDVDDWDSTMLR
ncbi:putative ripening-related protein 1 [Tanacetum coccineum]